MYFNRSPASNGWQHSFRLGSSRLINKRRPLEIAVLLFLSTVASFVLPDHVLNRLHAQYTLIHFDLYLRQGAKYDLVVFLGELVFDNVFGPTQTYLVHPRPSPR